VTARQQTFAKYQHMGIHNKRSQLAVVAQTGTVTTVTVICGSLRAFSPSTPGLPLKC
jgi:hypothetical protein